MHRSEPIRSERGPIIKDGEVSGSVLLVQGSQLHGLGCFARINFPKDTMIAEYAGERISELQAMRRMNGDFGSRISELGSDCYVDGSIGGNDTQYVNHSCEPNADALILNGLMFLFAKTNILPGDEITVDYLNSFENDKSA